MLATAQQITQRPQSGKTARVWAIADDITRTTGRMASRRAVMEKFQAEGGNANTASTQYSQWKADFIRSGAVEKIKPSPGNAGPVRLSMGTDGRLLIPAELRAAMMLDDSGTVTARVVDGELQVLSAGCAVIRAQKLVASVDRGAGSVVDELLAERRAEVVQDSST